MSIFHEFFGKRATVFKEKNKPLWTEIKKALKAGGVKGVYASATESEMPTCGCGAKLDIRDFGPNGKIDRNFYCIRVPESEAERSRAIIQEVRVANGVAEQQDKFYYFR